jgi:hypothetical protein
MERDDLDNSSIRINLTDIQCFAIGRAIWLDNNRCEPKPGMMVLDPTGEDGPVMGSVSTPSGNIREQLLATNNMDVVGCNGAIFRPAFLDQCPPSGLIIFVPSRDIGEDSLFNRQHLVLHHQGVGSAAHRSMPLR